MNHSLQIRQFSNIVESLATGGTGTSRRQNNREARSVSLRIQPLNVDFQADGDSFWAISRDISKRGIAFINSEPVTHEFLRVGLLEHDISVIGQVRHCTSIGDHYPLFLIGLEFFD